MTETSSVVTVAPDAPFLAGHFPGNPLVPGVVILDYVTDAVARMMGCAFELESIPTAKFTSPWRAGESLVIDLAPLDAGLVTFSCRVGERRVAEGSLRMRALPAQRE